MNARYLAHHIIYKGTRTDLAVLTITERPDGTHDIDISPFTHEIHSTAFHSGTIRVELTSTGPKLRFE